MTECVPITIYGWLTADLIDCITSPVRYPDVGAVKKKGLRIVAHRNGVLDDSVAVS